MDGRIERVISRIDGLTEGSNCVNWYDELMDGPNKPNKQLFRGRKDGKS